MTYEEMKKAYEAAMEKCSQLEKVIEEKNKTIEDKDLRIEHLTDSPSKALPSHRSYAKS